MNEEIHIGKLIQDKLREDGHAIAWLARKMNCDRTNVYKIFRKLSIDSARLLQISLILDYDFFVYYSTYITTHRKVSPFLLSVNDPINKEIHIGKLIRDKLREDGHAVAWLARKMNCDRRNIYRISRKPSIDTTLLLQISLILNYDFFVHYSVNITKYRKV